MKNTFAAIIFLLFACLFCFCDDLMRVEVAEPEASFFYRIKGCKGSKLVYEFVAKDLYAAQSTEYIWSVNDTIFPPETDPVFEHAFEGDGNFKVTLTARAFGFEASLSRMVRVRFEKADSLTFKKEFPWWTITGGGGDLQECPDGGLLFVGEIGTVAGIRVLVMKLDAYGDTVFTRIFPEHNSYPTIKPQNAVVEEDGTIVVAGQMFSSDSAGQSYLLRLDSEGNNPVDKVFPIVDMDNEQCFHIQKRSVGVYEILTYTKSINYFGLSQIDSATLNPNGVGSPIGNNTFQAGEFFREENGDAWVPALAVIDPGNSQAGGEFLLIELSPIWLKHQPLGNTLIQSVPLPSISKYPGKGHFWVGFTLDSAAVPTLFKYPDGLQIAQDHKFSNITATPDGGCIFASFGTQEDNFGDEFYALIAEKVDENGKNDWVSMPFGTTYSTDKIFGIAASNCERLCKKGYAFAGSTNGVLTIVRTDENGNFQ